MMILLGCFFAMAEAVPATKITGKFQIAGFSFGGKLPGNIYIGDNDEMHLQLMRPSGLSLISFTYTGEDVCFFFDFDNQYYQGSAKEFSDFSSGLIQANQVQHIFTADEAPISDWSWHQKNGKLKRLNIGSDPVIAQIRYNQWKQGDFNRITVDLLDSGWKLKGNLNSKEATEWDFQCQPPEDETPLPLLQMRDSIAPKQ